MVQESANTSVLSPTPGRTVKTVSESGNGCSAVEAARLTVVFSRVPVLRDVDLAVAPGESVALMGANGAGKSTLLKCLAGAVRPSTGQVRWFGNSVARSPVVRRQIGFVGHECGLYTEMTALENLMFAGRMYGVECVGDRAWELLAAIGLEPQADRLVGQLSQGMRRRLAIARALVHEPLLILLDEPFASLDAEGRRWLERFFQRWRCAGRTVCFASHDARQSHVLADRIVRLDAGRIVADERMTCLSTHSLRSA